MAVMAAMAGDVFLHPGLFTNGYGSIPIDTFLVGWTSIYQLFWGSLGTRVLTHPQMFSRLYKVVSFVYVEKSCSSHVLTREVIRSAWNSIREMGWSTGRKGREAAKMAAKGRYKKLYYSCFLWSGVNGSNLFQAQARVIIMGIWHNLHFFWKVEDIKVTAIWSL